MQVSVRDVIDLETDAGSLIEPIGQVRARMNLEDAAKILALAATVTPATHHRLEPERSEREVEEEARVPVGPAVGVREDAYEGAGKKKFSPEPEFGQSYSAIAVGAMGISLAEQVKSTTADTQEARLIRHEQHATTQAKVALGRLTVNAAGGQSDDAEKNGYRSDPTEGRHSSRKVVRGIVSCERRSSHGGIGSPFVRRNAELNSRDW